MIVDSSAFVAIVENEPEAAALALLMQSEPTLSMSTANWLETCLVLDRRTPAHPRKLDELAADLQITLEPVTAEHARLAREAHRRFGRGSGSPARLNFGDCFAYALAISTGDTLLFKGDDFTHTDVRPAWTPPS